MPPKSNIPNLIMIGSLLAAFTVLGGIAYILNKPNSPPITTKPTPDPSNPPDLPNPPQTKSFHNNGTLTVGYVNIFQPQGQNYPQLQSYLETELRKKYGNAVKVELESAPNTQETKSKIAQKKWDVAFTLLATNSIIAEDNKYEIIARMFPKQSAERNVCFFVKNDSKIDKIKDFTPDKTIALPSEDLPLFVMPFYDLYGKRVKVSRGNSLQQIKEKVSSGESDIGVGFCEMLSKDPQFKMLSPNRVIPVGGVYLSPKFENSDEREYVKKIFAEAPKEIKEKANYTVNQLTSYTSFRRINDRANELLNCVDFSKNPVDFYCRSSNK